jgi:hypothetical protein
MSSTQSMSPESVASQRDAFVERFLQMASGTFSLFSIYIGDRLGLYRALTEGGPATSAELAGRTGTHERYIREWLEQQTVTGILEVENASEETGSRRFSIPPGHAEPLIDCSSLNYMVPLAQLLVGATRPLPAVLDAYRNGGGVPFDEYGKDLREGQAAINYPAFCPAGRPCQAAGSGAACPHRRHRLRLRLVQLGDGTRLSQRPRGWLRPGRAVHRARPGERQT